MMAIDEPALWCAVAACAAYAAAAWPMPALAKRVPGTAALLTGWLLHLATLALDIGGIGLSGGAPRLGFAPVLSASVWLVIAVHAVESRFVPVPAVRVGLAAAGGTAVLLATLFPGEVRPFASALGPWHFLLGVAAHALVAAAVLHGLWLGSAERRLREHKGLNPLLMASPAAAEDGATAVRAMGLPLLQLERLTFRFVQAGFIVLTLTLLLGAATPNGLRIDHKTVFSLLAWACFAALLWGRSSRGWRGRTALRWLYSGSALLLLAYVGSRFVSEVLLRRPWT